MAKQVLNYSTLQIRPSTFLSGGKTINYLVVAWPAISLTWPLLSRLNKKNGLMFGRALRGIVQARMALPKGAKHDFYSIAAEDVGEGEEGLRRSEIWAEAVFFLPAGEF